MLFILLSLVCHSIYGYQTQQSIRPTDSLINTGNINEFGGAIPLPRVHHTLASTGNYIIAYGGYNVDGSYNDGIEIYDKMTQQWSGIITRKECCNDAGDTVETMGMASDMIDNTTTSRSKLNYPWTRVGYEGDIPLARGEHSSIVLGNSMVTPANSGSNGRNGEFTVNTGGLVNNTGGGGELMYMFGGVTEKYGYVNDLYMFDLVEMRWNVVDYVVTTTSRSSTVPQRRAGHSMVANVATVSGQMTEFYIFGGRGSDFGMPVVVFNDIWRFSTVTRAWTLLTYADTNKGNRNNRNNGNNDKSTTTSSATSSSTSFQAPMSPVGRQYAAATMLDGDRIWIYGGMNPANNLIFDDVWSFNVWTRVWIQYKSNTGNANGYAPPPLYYASLIPILPVNDDNNHEDLTTTGNITSPKIHENGFLIYGGMGAGGACGPILNNITATSSTTLGLQQKYASFCTPLESTLGQVYKFSIVIQEYPDNSTYSIGNQLYGVAEDMNKNDIHIYTNAEVDRGVYNQNIKSNYIKSYSWDHARVATDSSAGVRQTSTGMTGAGTSGTYYERTVSTRTDSVTTHSGTTTHSYRGKYHKTYGLERIVFDYNRGYVYQLGGLRTVPLSSSNANQNAASLVLHSTPLDSGGYLSPVSWDIHSGEWLKNTMSLPTNGVWVYSDGFISSQTQDSTSTTTNTNYTQVEFLRSFKMLHNGIWYCYWRIGLNRKVLLLEDWIE